LLAACYWPARASRSSAAPVSHPAPFRKILKIFHPERTVGDCAESIGLPGAGRIDEPGV
jgi:hypothetical protein